MASAAIPGPSTSSGQPEIQPQQSSKFVLARKCVEPLKGPPITNVSGFMACHLELNYAEVSTLIGCYTPFINSDHCYWRAILMAYIINGWQS